jgi:hypothetical protein
VSHFCRISSSIHFEADSSLEEAAMISGESAELYFREFCSSTPVQHTIPSSTPSFPLGFPIMAVLGNLSCAGAACRVSSGGNQRFTPPGGHLRDVICNTGSTTVFSPVHEYGLVGCFY